MMYQRDIVLTFEFQKEPSPRPSPSGGEGTRLGEEAQQLLDDGRKDGVDAEEEEGEEEGHDHHHDAGRHGLLARRPMDLAGLDADLTDEFAGGGFGHFCLLASR